MLSKIFKLCFNDAASTISTVERFRSSTIIDIPKTRNRTEITQELLAVQDQEEPQNKENSESVESSSDENLNSVAEIDSDSDSVTSYLTAYSSNSSVSSDYFHDKNDQNQNNNKINFVSKISSIEVQKNFPRTKDDYFPFMRLPTDLHLEIKKYLPLPEICQLRLVNKYCLEKYSKPEIWQNLSIDSSSKNYCLTKALKKLEIFCNNQSREELNRMHIILFQAINTSNIIEELAIHGFFTPRSLVKTFAKIGTTLRKLSVYNVPSILHPKVLESMSKDLINLNSLHVSLADHQAEVQQSSTTNRYYPRGNSLDIAGLRVAISKCDSLTKFSISISNGTTSNNSTTQNSNNNLNLSNFNPSLDVQVRLNRERSRSHSRNQSADSNRSSNENQVQRPIFNSDFYDDDVPISSAANFRDFLSEQDGVLEYDDDYGQIRSGSTNVVIERL